MLERDHELAVFTAAVEEARQGRGSVVLVQGEAGIGKSTLVAALQDRFEDRIRLLVGRCDDLALPRVLGPFRDLMGAVGPELTAALRDPVDRDAVLMALQADLSSQRPASVLAIEDLQWADEPTLDVLRFLVRRVDRMPVVLLLTYRDDELRHTLGWALVGDAGYFKDPITAHGLTDALRDAELLAGAILDVLRGIEEEVAMAGYQTTRDALSADLFDVTEVIAGHQWTDAEISDLLIRLSRSMSAEVSALVALPTLMVQPFG